MRQVGLPAAQANCDTDASKHGECGNKAYDVDLGGAQLRVRGRPRLRRPHRRQGDTVSVTTTYVRASVAEVATALAALTGEPHPLALPGGGKYDSAG